MSSLLFVNIANRTSLHMCVLCDVEKSVRVNGYLLSPSDRVVATPTNMPSICNLSDSL